MRDDPRLVVSDPHTIDDPARFIRRGRFGFRGGRNREQPRRVADEFRRRRIPLDTIVMDWQYWRPEEWGSHEFDPARFPDPTAWIREIHERYHAKLMISVWPKFFVTLVSESPGASLIASLRVGRFPSIRPTRV